MLRILVLLLLLPSLAFAERISTTKTINLTQLAAELAVIVGVPNTLPMNASQGEYVEEESGQATAAQLQQAIDAHVFVAPPAGVPRNFVAEYASQRGTIAAGPIRNMFDLLAEERGLR